MMIRALNEEKETVKGSQLSFDISISF